MAEIAEAQAATLQRFLDAWKHWNAAETINTFAEGTRFRQVTLPYQMNVPARSRTEVERVLPFLERAVQNYNIQIHRVLHDREKGEAAIYAISKGDTPFGPWNMEYAVFLTFTESGDRIETLEEMLDSNHALWFGPQFQKWIREQNVAQGVSEFSSQN